MAIYKSPKIFADLLSLYKMCAQKHQGIARLFRITVSEKILHEIIDCMRLTALANFKRTNTRQIASSLEDVMEMRGRIEIIKAYFLVAWDMRHYSHEFYALVDQKIQEISKQATSWEKWLEGHQP